MSVEIAENFSWYSNGTVTRAYTENRLWLLAFPVLILTLNGSVLLTLYLRPTALRKNPFVIFSTLTTTLVGSVGVPLRAFFPQHTLLDAGEPSTLSTAPCLAVKILPLYCALQTTVATAFLSVDRYLPFTRHLERYKRWVSRKRNAVIAIGISVVACLALHTSPVFETSENATRIAARNYKTYCHSRYVVTTNWLIAMVVCHATVTLLVFAANVCLARHLVKVRRSVNPSSAINNQATIKAAIISLVLSITFLVTWTPLIVVMVFDASCAATKRCSIFVSSKNAPVSYRAPAILSMLYSCVQPVILVCGSKKLRQAMKSIFSTPLNAMRGCTETTEDVG